MEGNEKVSTLTGFLNNRWTSVVIPLIAVGALSWGAFKNENDQLMEEFQKSQTESGKTQKLLLDRVILLEKEQEKDTVFRQSGERFSSSDALKMEIRLRSEFQHSLQIATQSFTSKIDANQKENVRRLERLEEKLDKVIQGR